MDQKSQRARVAPAKQPPLIEQMLEDKAFLEKTNQALDQLASGDRGVSLEEVKRRFSDV